jgi:DnaJ-class molecular chaperone
MTTTGLAFYDALNVPKTASPEEIKKAYRKLAVQLHPDKGGNPEEFKKISEAYQTLSDPSKRSMYDQLGDEGYAMHQDGGGGMDFGGDFNPFDLFRNMFGGGGGGGGFFGGGGMFGGGGDGGRKVMRHTITLTLDEAYAGALRRLRVKEDTPCAACEATCPTCKGTGMQTQQLRMGPMIQVINSPCGACGGRGKTSSPKKSSCSECKGAGKTVSTHVVDVRVPPGIESGTNIRVRASATMDIVVAVTVSPHPVFMRKGNNIVMEVSLTFRESLLGKKFAVPHFDGEIKVDTASYGIVYDGKKVSYAGKGMPDMDSGNNGSPQRGDLVVIYSVEPVRIERIPEGLRTLMSKMCDELEKVASSQVKT